MDNLNKCAAVLVNWVVVGTYDATGAPEPSLDGQGNGTVQITAEQHSSDTLGGLVYQPSTGQFLAAE